MSRKRKTRSSRPSVIETLNKNSKLLETLGAKCMNKRHKAAIDKLIAENQELARDFARYYGPSFTLPTAVETVLTAKRPKIERKRKVPKHGFDFYRFIEAPGLQHIAKNIFDNLDDKDVANWRLVSTACKDVIDNDKSWWRRQIQGMIENEKAFVKFQHLKKLSDKTLLKTMPYWRKVYDYFAQYEDLETMKLFVKLMTDFFSNIKNYKENPFQFTFRVRNHDSNYLNEREKYVEILFKSPLNCHEYLISYGVDNMPPLHYIITLGKQKKSLDIVLKNISTKYLNQTSGCFSLTPLHSACRPHGEIEILEKLIAIEGIEANKRDENDGLTPLQYACRQGCAEHVKVLLDHASKINLDINPWRKSGGTILHDVFYAEQDKIMSLFQAILNHPKLTAIHINARNRCGRTVLHQICRGNVEIGDTHVRITRLEDYEASAIVRCFLDLAKGVDINIRDNNGLTAKDYARTNKYHEVVQMLNEFLPANAN